MNRENQVKQALASYIDPFLGIDYFTAKVPVQITLLDNKVTVIITVGYPVGSEQPAEITTYLQQILPGYCIDVQLLTKIEARTVQGGRQKIAAIKNIIAVASGKGGVGKSTTAVNLALALASQGAAVGLLDADIYGPNQPQMLGIQLPLNIDNQKPMQPIMQYGIQSMSIGYLIDSTTPIVWRGPMVTGALLQLLNETQWQALDYLFIDLPPGTGDVQLTLAQKIPVCGAVIVTTPQEVALLDARKGIEMFYKVKIPVLGIIENMSVHVCDHCGHQDAIFGQGGGKKIAQEYDVPLLGQLPLIKKIRQQADSGKPTVIAEPESETAALYHTIARKIAGRLSLQARNYDNILPKIIIENN